MRSQNREHNQLRPITITKDYTKYAEGSVLVEFGHTKVLCNASVIDSVPRFLKGKNQGWITAEYSMLPRATHTRSDREATRGKQGGRTLEIQRLIGRALRASIDLSLLGEITIALDCDVLQADGGTRTASITGACVAMVDALRYLQRSKLVKNDPLRFMVASVSVGIVAGVPLLDLDYSEDSSADTDMNIVMTDSGQFIEIQGTAEKKPFNATEFNQMLSLAEEGMAQLFAAQRDALMR